MRCEGALALDAIDRDGSGLVSFEALVHVRSCPRCRRELETMRKLRRDLHGLAPRPAPGEQRGLADGLLAGILAALDAEDHRAARRSVYALAGGAFAAGLAAAGLALALSRTRRRPA